MTKQIRVLVVDDHPVVREGLSSMIGIQPDMILVAESGNGKDAVDLHRKYKPDVTLMDLRLPGLTGIEATREIRKSFPNARIIVLTISEGDEDIYRALDAGAQAYLIKDAQREEMLNTIREVFAGKRYIPSRVAANLTERWPRADLTPREIDVLRKIAEGESNKTIATELNISETTVKVHVSNILEKLGAGDRTEAVTIALRRGILSL